MKKWVFLLICITVALTMVINTQAKTIAINEINKDPYISTNDIRMLLRANVGKDALSAHKQALYDCNRDGVCSTSDARIFLTQEVSGEELSIQQIPFHSYSLDISQTMNNIFTESNVIVITTKQEWVDFTITSPAVTPDVFYEKKIFDEEFF